MSNVINGGTDNMCNMSYMRSVKPQKEMKQKRYTDKNSSIQMG